MAGDRHSEDRTSLAVSWKHATAVLPPNRPTLSIERVNDAELRLTLRGKAGLYVLRATADFTVWQDLRSIEIGSGGIATIDRLEQQATAPHRFYRLVQP